jgi:hypothetical protein
VKVSVIIPAYNEGALFNLGQAPCSLQLGYYFLPAFVPVDALVFPCLFSHLAILVNNLNQRQRMPKSNLKVIRIMGRSDLDSSCPEFRVCPFISDNRYLPVHDREDDMPAHDVLISRVTRVYSNRSITQHCLRACRRNLYMTLSVGEGIINIVKSPFCLFMFDFKVGQRRVAPRAPIHNVGSFVYEPLLIKTYENPADGSGKAFIHSEPFPLPITGRAKPLKLMSDSPAVLVLPFPDTLYEFFPS